MNMTLYSYSGDPRQLNKPLTSIATVTIIAITDSTNILSPSIIIGTRSFNFNYAYIPTFNRYYYVDDIVVNNGERITLKLRVDVLMSHRAAINASTVIAERSSSRINPYLEDHVVACKEDITSYVRNMGNSPFNTYTYLLSVGGQ